MKQQLADPSVNVFTGEAFGESSKSSEFDMESIITVDEAKLEQAFGYDESSFAGLADTLSGALSGAALTLEARWAAREIPWICPEWWILAGSAWSFRICQP